MVMYGCESWTVKKAEHWRIDAFELWCWRRLESPLDCKKIRPVHSDGDQLWVFFGRNDAKAETPVLWPPHAKNWLIGKDSDAGRDCGQEEKVTTEDEMAGWHHWLDRRESEWTPGVGDGQGGLVCCDYWGCKESDMTERLNWTELIPKLEYGLSMTASKCHTLTDSLHVPDDLVNHGVLLCMYQGLSTPTIQDITSLLFTLIGNSIGKKEWTCYKK